MFAGILTDNKIRIAANTIYQLVAKGFTMAITVLATIVLSRTYGVTGFGEFSLMQTWPALFFIIVDFGINAIATRELSSDESKAGHYIGNILMIRLALSAFLIVLLNLVLTVPNLFTTYSQGLIFGIRLSLFLILTQALFTTCTIVFQTKLRYDLAAIAQIVGYVVILVWLGVTSYLHYAVEWVNFGYVVGGVVTFVIGLHYVKKLGVKITFTKDTALWKYLFAQSLPLGIMFVFSQLNFKADAMLLSVVELPARFGLTNTQSAGIYNLPYKVFEVVLVLPTFFMNAVYPIMVKKHAESPEALKSILKKVFGILLTAGLVTGLSGVLFSRIIVQILGGSEFEQSVLVLQILFSGLFLYFLTSPLSWLVLTLGQQKYLPFVYFVVAFVNILLNFVLIPYYSFYASAVITHVSELLVLIIIGYFAHKTWKDYYVSVPA